jgi:hypothetical protein
MHWASVYLGVTGSLLPPIEWQVIAFLPSVGNLAFLLFGVGARILSLSVTVGSVRPQCSVGREASWHQKNSKAWNLRFT